MHVWQANLGRGVPPHEFIVNLTRVLEAAGPRAIIGFQEVDEADRPEEREILERLARRTHHFVGLQTSVPILIPKHLEILDELQTIASKGLALFTPLRPLNEALIQIGPNLTAAVLDLHIPIDRPETQSRRADAVEKLQERAAARKAQGHAGVWISDTNTRRGWPRIVHGERIVTDAGIDKAKAWAPPGRRVIVSQRRTIRLTIDGHNAHGARVLFVPRSS